MSVQWNQPIVFVLGAGFTKSFDQEAPLMNCDIGLDNLKVKFTRENLPRISAFLDSIKENANFEVNIEELLSRLFVGMPYDRYVLYTHERQLLEKTIMRIFSDKIKAIKSYGEVKNSTDHIGGLLDVFTEYILDTKSSIISFNYDTLVDESLSNHRLTKGTNPWRWDPSGGYGFFCRSAESCIGLIGDEQASYSSLLLKMHGSINWFAKLGFNRPYPLDAIVHYENWDSFSPPPPENRNLIESHIEENPIIIPPVLDKSSLSKEPLMKKLWAEAFLKLRQAETIIFIGYSFPVTDIATRSLFREALLTKNNKPNIFVINTSSETEKTYTEILGGIVNNRSFFKYDAKQWIHDFLVPEHEKQTTPQSIG